MPQRQPLTSDVDSDLLAEVQALAEREGRDLDALVDEALADLVEKRRADQSGADQPRDRVMAAYQQSHERYSELYKKLAE